MLSISHTLIGAYIAHTIPHPGVYIPLSLAAHYFCDWIPHWDIGTGLSNGKRKKTTAIILEIGELIISIALIYFLFQKGHDTFQWHIWLAALIGIAPDLLEAPRNFLSWEPRFLTKINNFHDQFHSSTSNVLLGLSPQVTVVLSIILLSQ